MVVRASSALTDSDVESIHSIKSSPHKGDPLEKYSNRAFNLLTKQTRIHMVQYKLEKDRANQYDHLCEIVDECRRLFENAHNQTDVEFEIGQPVLAIVSLDHNDSEFIYPGIVESTKEHGEPNLSIKITYYKTTFTKIDKHQVLPCDILNTINWVPKSRRSRSSAEIREINEQPLWKPRRTRSFDSENETDSSEPSFKKPRNNFHALVRKTYEKQQRFIENLPEDKIEANDPDLTSLEGDLIMMFDNAERHYNIELKEGDEVLYLGQSKSGQIRIKKGVVELVPLHRRKRVYGIKDEETEQMKKVEKGKIVLFDEPR